MKSPKPTTDEQASSAVASPATRASPSTASPTRGASPATASPGVAEEPSNLQPPEFWQPLSEDDGDSAVGDDAESSTASVASSIMHYRTINGRTYHSERAGGKYWGANDDKQNNTVDIMHHAYTRMIGDTLNLAPLPEKIDKALDIGTGTGLWAMDFADMYPDTTVIGTDLSPIQPDWVPPNLHFQIEDFTQDWTFENGSFDYVHGRWLLGAVPDWYKLFENAYRVLKPGGWLESVDFNAISESDDGTVTEKTALYQWGYIFQEGIRKAGSSASFSVVKEGLQRKAMEAAGFINIEEKPLKLPISEWPLDPTLREIGLYTRVAMQNDIEGLMGFPAAQLGWSKEQIMVYAAHVRKELQELKIHAFYRSCAVWGQKPLAKK